MENLISSQRFLDESIVAEKAENEDFSCKYYRISVNGTEYRVLVDGHHSYAAAKAAGVEPELDEVDGQIKAEFDGQVADLGAEGWLEAHYHDAPYYHLDTGVDVW